MKTEKFLLTNYIKDGLIDFDKIKTDTIKKWQNYGLKDDCIRDFYFEIATNEQKLNLLKKGCSKFCSNKKFFNLINSGLLVDQAYLKFSFNNGEIISSFYKPSFLNQAIMKKDCERIEMLLAAGAKPKFEPKDTFVDTLGYIVNYGDLNSLALILSFTDNMPEKHWIFGALQNMDSLGAKNAKFAAQIIIQKLNQEQKDCFAYAINSINYYEELMQEQNNKIQENKLQKSQSENINLTKLEKQNQM